jgi:hypothetical protein
MALSNVRPGPVESLPERSSPSPAPSQGPLTHITRPSSGGYRDSNQEIRDLQLTHATRSEMAAGELLDRDTGGEGSFTLWVHGGFIVGFE